MLNLISDAYYSISNAYSSSSNMGEFVGKAFLTPINNPSTSYFAGHTILGAVVGINALGHFADTVRKVRKTNGWKELNIRDAFNLASLSSVVLPAAAAIGYTSNALQYCFSNLSPSMAVPLLAVCGIPLAYWGAKKIAAGIVPAARNLVGSIDPAARSLAGTINKVVHLRFNTLTREDYRNLIIIGSVATIGLTIGISGAVTIVGSAGYQGLLYGGQLVSSLSTSVLAPLFSYPAGWAWSVANGVLPYAQIINSWTVLGNSVFHMVDVFKGKTKGVLNIDLSGEWASYLKFGSTAVAAVGAITGVGGLTVLGLGGLGVSIFANQGFSLDKPVAIAVTGFAGFQIFRSGAKMFGGTAIISSLPSLGPILGPLAVLGPVAFVIGRWQAHQYTANNPDQKSIFHDGYAKAMLRVTGNTAQSIPILGWLFSGTEKLELKSGWRALPLVGGLAYAAGVIAIPTLMLSFACSLPFSATILAAGGITALAVGLDKKYGIFISGALEFALQVKSPEHVRRAETLITKINDLHQALGQFDWANHLPNFPVVPNRARNPVDLFAPPPPPPVLPAIGLPIGVVAIAPLVAPMPVPLQPSLNQFMQDLQIFAAHSANTYRMTDQEKQRLYGIGMKLAEDFYYTVKPHMEQELGAMSREDPRPVARIAAVTKLQDTMMNQCYGTLNSLVKEINPAARHR